ncbi:MAG: ATP-binding protein [Thermoproteota archaeon]|nr:ATP-binding protein [Candidatus Brockarchaeota archaeon]
MKQKLETLYFVAITIFLIAVFKNAINALFFLSNNLTIVLIAILIVTIIAVFLLKRRYESIIGFFSIDNEKYLVLKTQSSEFIMGGVSVSREDVSESSLKADDYYQKIQSFVSGVLKSGVKLTCITHISPSDNPGEYANLMQILVVSRKVEYGKLEESLKMVETDIEKIKSIYNTVFPEFRIVELSGKELVKYLNNILINRIASKKSTSNNLKYLFAVHTINSFLPLSSESHTELQKEKRLLNLGSIVFNGSRISPLNLKEDVFKKHVAIYGSTGSGKTTTAKRILRELAKLGYSFTVLDWHNEYRHLAEELNGKVLELGSFSLDIINPIESENLSEHVAIVTDIFDQIYNFTPSQSYMFREVLLQTLVEKELGIKANNPLVSFIETLEKWSIKSFYENETKFALLRRLKPLITGQNREIFCNRDKLISIRDILEGVTIFELGDIVEVDMRKLTSLFILAMIYEYRLKNRDEKCHFIVLEEAHNILPYRRRESPPTIAEKLFLEMRKFNESLILISQFPSQISPEVVKSTGLKISHRICEGEESRTLIDIMGLSQVDYDLLKRLPPGYGFLIAEGISKPILLSVDFNEKAY